GVRGRVQPAAMGVDDRAADGEANPIPFALVVWNGLNSCAWISGARPGPVSHTATSAMVPSVSDSIGTVETRRWRGGGLSVIASTLLRTRLNTTCWIWILSMKTDKGAALR